MQLQQHSDDTNANKLITLRQFSMQFSKAPSFERLLHSAGHFFSLVQTIKLFLPDDGSIVRAARSKNTKCLVD